MCGLVLWSSPTKHQPWMTTLTRFIIHTEIILKDLKSNAAGKLNEDDVFEAFCCHLSINADYILMFT